MKFCILSELDDLINLSKFHNSTPKGLGFLWVPRSQFPRAINSVVHNTLRVRMQRYSACLHVTMTMPYTSGHDLGFDQSDKVNRHYSIIQKRLLGLIAMVDV